MTTAHRRALDAREEVRELVAETLRLRYGADVRLGVRNDPIRIRFQRSEDHAPVYVRISFTGEA
jgi:hypothetical protein